MADEPKDWTTCEVDVEVLAVSDKALYVTDGDKQGWVAKSLIRDSGSLGPDARKGASGSLAIPQWLAEEREFV